MFTERKISAFQNRISDLPDIPTLTASELKARFDACPEELREALNGVCDDGKVLENRMDEYRAQTFTGEITRAMLSSAVKSELDSKADEESMQTAFKNESDARQSGDSALETKVAAKCEIYTGSYTGNGSSKTISLGFRPKAVLVMARQYGDPYSAILANLALPGVAAPYVAVTATGFQVSGYLCESDEYAKGGNPYRYIAFK